MRTRGILLGVLAVAAALCLLLALRQPKTTRAEMMQNRFSTIQSQVSPEVVTAWARDAMGEQAPEDGHYFPDPDWTERLPGYLHAFTPTFLDSTDTSVWLSFGDSLDSWWLVVSDPGFVAALEDSVVIEWVPGVYFCYDDIRKN